MQHYVAVKLVLAHMFRALALTYLRMYQRLLSRDNFLQRVTLCQDTTTPLKSIKKLRFCATVCLKCQVKFCYIFMVKL